MNQKNNIRKPLVLVDGRTANRGERQAMTLGTCQTCTNMGCMI